MGLWETLFPISHILTDQEIWEGWHSCQVAMIGESLRISLRGIDGVPLPVICQVSPAELWVSNDSGSEPPIHSIS